MKRHPGTGRTQEEEMDEVHRLLNDHYRPLRPRTAFQRTKFVTGRFAPWYVPRPATLWSKVRFIFTGRET